MNKSKLTFLAAVLLCASLSSTANASSKKDKEYGAGAAGGAAQAVKSARTVTYRTGEYGPELAVKSTNQVDQLMEKDPYKSGEVKLVSDNAEVQEYINDQYPEDSGTELASREAMTENPYDLSEIDSSVESGELTTEQLNAAGGKQVSKFYNDSELKRAGENSADSEGIKDGGDFVSAAAESKGLKITDEDALNEDGVEFANRETMVTNTTSSNDYNGDGDSAAQEARDNDVDGTTSADEEESAADTESVSDAAQTTAQEAQAEADSNVAGGAEITPESVDETEYAAQQTKRSDEVSNDVDAAANDGSEAAEAIEDGDAAIGAETAAESGATQVQQDLDDANEATKDAGEAEEVGDMVGEDA